jgi:hypothetical protein
MAYFYQYYFTITLERKMAIKVRVKKKVTKAGIHNNIHKIEVSIIKANFKNMTEKIKKK